MMGLRNSVSRSCNSLCLIDGNLPLAQDRASSTDKLWNGVQPYHRAMASKNAPLWRVNSCSARGRAISQVEAPFSSSPFANS